MALLPTRIAYHNRPEYKAYRIPFRVAGQERTTDKRGSKAEFELLSTQLPSLSTHSPKSTSSLLTGRQDYAIDFSSVYCVAANFCTERKPSPCIAATEKRYGLETAPESTCCYSAAVPVLPFWIRVTSPGYLLYTQANGRRPGQTCSANRVSGEVEKFFKKGLLCTRGVAQIWISVFCLTMPKEKVHVWGYLLCKLGANCVHGLRYTPTRNEPLDAIGKVSIPAFKKWEYKPGAMYISVGKAAMAIL